MSDQLPMWESIAVSDWYRASESKDKAELKSLYLRDVAPRVYGQVWQNPQTRSQVVNRVHNFELGPLLEDEQKIITPDTLTMDGIKGVISSPEFAEKDFRTQQNLKSVWFHKLAANDPEFQEMNMEQQQAYYRRLMEAAPSYSSKLYNFAAGPDKSVTGLIIPMNEEALERVEEEDDSFYTGFNKFTSNLITSFLQGSTSLIVGPLRALTGEDSQLAQTVRDIQKENAWWNTVHEGNQFLTGALPSLGGYMAGLMVGPFKGLERGLAGGAYSLGAKGAGRSTGLLKAVGSKVTSKVPDLAYEVAGGATAGLIEGVSAALAEGKDWKTYIPRDLSLGVGFEFMGRYIGMVREIKRYAKEAGVKAENIFRAPFDPSGGQAVNPALAAVFKGNPDAAKLVQEARSVDPNGLLLRHLDKPEGAKIRADVLGYEVEEAPNALRLKKDGNVVKEFTAAQPSTRYLSASHWMDSQHREAFDAWLESGKRKSVSELASTAESIELRQGHFVPVEARRYIINKLDKKGIHLGLTPAGNPRGSAKTRADLATARSNQATDEIIDIVRNQSGKKAAGLLRQRGIILDNDFDVQRAEVLQMKKDLANIMPQEPYIIRNKKTGNQVEYEHYPNVYLEHPDLQQPSVFKHVMAGNPRQIRDSLHYLERTRRNVAAEIKRKATTHEGEVYRYPDNNTIELRMRMPGGKGELSTEVLVHFPTMASAKQALQRGRITTTKGKKRVFDIFSEDQTLQNMLDEFDQTMYKYDPKRARMDYGPFEFVSLMARQNDYYLGVYRGKYILQDGMEESLGKYETFDTLQDVANRLKEVDGRQNLPDFMHGLDIEAAELLEGKITDPLKVDLKQVKRKKNFGLFGPIRYYLQPPQYFLDYMERVDVQVPVRKLDDGSFEYANMFEHFNLSPVRMFNQIQDASRAVNSYSTPRIRYGRELAKGVNAKEGKAIGRYMQAFSTPDEASSLRYSKEFEEFGLKEDVLREMVRDFGSGRANELVRKAEQLNVAFTDMFNTLDMNWSMFQHNYLPRMKTELKKHANLSDRFDIHKLLEIPRTEDRAAFFEMLREADPARFAFEEDPFKLFEEYTHIAARKVHLRPTMKMMGGQLRNIVKQVNDKGVTPNEFRVFIRYMADLFQTVEGVRGQSDEIFDLATANFLEGVSKRVLNITGRKFDLKQKGGLISKLIHLSTGAHLAARPYPVMRNLTQSYITGGTLIGDVWWAEGVDRLTKTPNVLRRMEDLGIVKIEGMPVGVGEQMPGIINAAMKPYKWSDTVNRSIIYMGMEARVDDAIRQFSKGNISMDQFMKKSGATLFGKAQYNELGRIINKAPNNAAGFRAFKDRIARMAVERTQYLYNRFDQPVAFRRNIGRLAGQYTSWPNNFYNFVTRTMLSDSMSVAQKAAFMARLTAATGLTAQAMHEAGLNAQGYMPMNMMMMSAGPYYQLLDDMVTAVSRGDMQAWQRGVRTIVGLVPFSNETRGVWRAIKAFQDGEMYEGILHLMSAPVNYDVFPQRGSALEDITGIQTSLMEAGNKYIDFKSSTTERLDRRGEVLFGD